MKKTKNRSIFTLPRLLNHNNNPSISSKQSFTINSVPISNNHIRQCFIRSRNFRNNYDENFLENKTHNSILSTSRGSSTKQTIFKTLRKVPLSNIYYNSLNSDNDKMLSHDNKSEYRKKGLSLSSNKKNIKIDVYNISQMHFNKPLKRKTKRKTILESLDIKYKQLDKEFKKEEMKTMKNVKKRLMMNLKETQRFKKVKNNINPFHAITICNYEKNIKIIHNRVQSLNDN